MFCSNCGHEVQSAARFCGFCGAGVTGVSQCTNDQSTNAGAHPSSVARPMTWDEFQSMRSAAEAQRQSGWVSKKTRKCNSSSFHVTDEVTFSIGLLKRVECRTVLERGSVETVTVCTDSSYTEVLECAIQKFSLLNDNFNRQAEYELVFKDGRPANVIPGTGEPFTVKRHKTMKNVPYSKLKLFLCPREDCLSEIDNDQMDAQSSQLLPTDAQSNQLLPMDAQSSQLLPTDAQSSQLLPTIDSSSDIEEHPICISSDEDASFRGSQEQQQNEHQRATTVDNQPSCVTSGHQPPHSVPIRHQQPLFVNHEQLRQHTGTHRQPQLIISETQHNCEPAYTRSSPTFENLGTPTIQLRSTAVTTFIDDSVEFRSSYDTSHGHDQNRQTNIMVTNEFANEGNINFQHQHLELQAFRELTFVDLMNLLGTVIDKDGGKNIVNVDRSDILDGGYRAFARQSFNPNRLLCVKFAGEDGIDAGGLTREFLRLAFESIRTCGLFVGPDYAKFLTLDYKALENKTYELMGKVIAYGIVHQGCLPQFISESLYSVLTNGYGAAQVHLCDVSDQQLRNQLQRIVNSSTEECFQEALSPVISLIELSGCLSLTLNVSARENVVRHFSHFYVIAKNILAIEQFKSGLDTLGVLQAMKDHPDVMREAFIYSPNRLDATCVEAIFSVAHWSSPGSNKYRDEQRTQTYWRDFLQDLEEMEHLEKLLLFALGTHIVPPSGFNPEPVITFGHDVARDADDITRQFPVANTCANVLRLPILPSYNDFKENMLSAITMVTTFTLL